ncbi:amyloid fiber anchoring/assembly protein TapA [Pueribacillus theae]|nr:amyloid fiber anchoring/assembly protein TapA [Pueribacillus theae]
MRQSRLRKFRKKNVGIYIIVQLAAIYYLGFIGLSLVTSTTNAAFTSSVNVPGSIQAGDWDFWDKSSLKFPEGKKNFGFICKGEKVEIFARIENGKDSEAMQGPVKYEVYWIEKGNPKNGKIVDEGEVPQLGSGQTYKLTFISEKPGNYKFKAYQREGHPGKGELWSETITVEPNECIQPKELEELETEEVENLSEADKQNSEKEHNTEANDQDKPEKNETQVKEQEKAPPVQQNEKPEDKKQEETSPQEQMKKPQPNEEGKPGPKEKPQEPKQQESKPEQKQPEKQAEVKAKSLEGREKSIENNNEVDQ